MNAARGKKTIVFISYRRIDADAVAGRLKDRMALALPDWDVFMDVESIAAGANYRVAIDESIARSAVFLPVIGTRWLEEHKARTAAGEDLVRYEIKSALDHGVRIIPVLVNGARMVERRDLAAEIAALADYNAVELRHARFDDDFGHLVGAIAGRRAGARGRRGTVAVLRDALIGALAGVAVALAALMIDNAATGASADQRIGELGAALLFPACALIGALIWLWAAPGKR